MKTYLSVLVVAASCFAQTRLQGPVYVYRYAGGGKAAMNLQKLDIRDSAGGVLLWDFQADVGNPASTTVKAYMRDNSGATVQEWERTFLGAASNVSRLDMSLEPMTTDTRALGTSSKRWTNGYINDLYGLRLRASSGSSLEVYADWIPDGDGTRGLGSGSRRWADIRTQNITISGTCTGCPSGYWSRDGSGYVIPTTAADDVRFRKWVMMDSAGGTTFWDLQGDIGNPASTTVKAYMRDNAGATVQEWERTFLGAASNISRLDMSLEPMTDAARNFGSSSKRWVNGYITDVYTLRLRPSAGSSLEIYGDLNPDGDNTRGLGSASRKWADIRTQNITISGTCTGCPGGAVTDGGATTYVTATGDSFAVGTTSTSSKFEVSGGSSMFGGSLLFSFDNSYSLGSSSTRANTLYTYDLNIADDILCSSDGACNIGNGSGSDSPGNVYATAGMFVMNGAGSSVVRASISGSGLIVRDSSGNQTATVNATSGYVDASGGYRKSGSTGVTQTLNVATSALGTCTITVTGGIITASTC